MFRDDLSTCVGERNHLSKNVITLRCPFEDALLKLLYVIHVIHISIHLYIYIYIYITIYL